MILSIFNFNGSNISCNSRSILLLSLQDFISFNDTRRLLNYSNDNIISQSVLCHLLGYFNQFSQSSI